MPTFQKANTEVLRIAQEVLAKYPEHKPLIEVGLKIDYVFAFASLNDDGEPVGHALTKNGVMAYGIARILNLKDRVKGLGDCEIAIDGDWWATTGDEEKAALIDHELYHFSLKVDKKGAVQMDDIGRPKLKLRKHDYEFGWFNAVAKRHGVHSLERHQAKQILDNAGQYYWPALCPGLSNDDDTTTTASLVKR